MSRFTVIEDVAVILSTRGLFRQSKVYQRDGFLFAGYGNGFIRLCADGVTSLPNTRWDGLEIEETQVAKFGWLRLK